jgi:hypothetical protein
MDKMNKIKKLSTISESVSSENRLDKINDLVEVVNEIIDRLNEDDI